MSSLDIPGKPGGRTIGTGTAAVGILRAAGQRSANQQSEAPLAHYRELYRGLDPEEIARRCGLAFTKAGEGGFFKIRLMGIECRTSFPEFVLRFSSEDAGPSQGAETPQSIGPSQDADIPQEVCGDPYEQILLLRYLCEGKYFKDQGKRLSYNEIPWGPVYFRNFEGRCLKRLAFAFGNKLDVFRRIMENTPGLRAEAWSGWAAGTGDAVDRGTPAEQTESRAGFRFEFINGLYISLLVWAGDDEFPPSAQILFDDNFVFAFTAEDLAVVGEVVIKRLKAYQ